MFARPYLAAIALAGTILGGAVAAKAEGSPYPLPSAPPGATTAGPATPDAAHPHRGWLKRALLQMNLSQQQRTQIRAMVASYRASRKTSTPMTRRQLIANISGVLTPDQLTQFNTMRPRHRAHARNRALPAASPTPAAS